MNQPKYTQTLKWSDEDRFLIGQHAIKNSTASAVRCFRTQFPTLNESTIRAFKKKIQQEQKKASLTGEEPLFTVAAKHRGRPLLLGAEIVSMVQRYILSASNRGAVISRAVDVSTAKALMKRYPAYISQLNIDFDSSSELGRKVFYVG